MTMFSGQILKGYDVYECIGQGAFGAVYRAHQTIVDREVAIKVILPQYANQPDFIRRFETEAQLVARLEHLYIVPLYDYWRDPDGAYLVMRYLRGGSLKEWIGKGALDPGETLRLVEQIAQALAVAHRHGVVHRDIKPSNILLDEERNAYLADFGIAKVLGGEPSMEGLRGTLDYVSPEQIRSQPVTAQTDVYALGIVLYEMLTGAQPFSPSSTPAELLHKHLETPVPDIQTKRDGLPDVVNGVIQTATAKTPTDRYTDAPELARALREALAAVELAPAVVEQPLIEPLTDRELDVLRLMAEGLSHGEIAQKLVLAVTTIKWYAQEIYGKLGVSSKRQAVAVGQRLGLLEGAAERRDIALPDWMVGHNPYKGLASFQQADAPDFFGRETLVDQLVSRLQEHDDLAHFLAVVGPSGSGKSSVVRAGLLPALKQGRVAGSENWFVVDMLPGGRPLDELEIRLTQNAIRPVPDLAEQLRRDAHGLTRASRMILPVDEQLLLVIDQFEELFTLAEDPAVSRHVLDLIYAAVTDPRSRVRVIITLRADFLDRSLIYSDFGELLRSRTELIVSMNPAELEAAIVKPAEMAGVTVESGLVAALVAEVHEQPGTLPLLEYALTELFERRQGRTMTLTAYQALGGALGVLTRQADEVYDDLSDAEQDTARQGFLRLVTLGEGTEDVRRRVLLSELSAIGTSQNGMEDVLDLFGEYRLLTFDRDPQTREPTVEVAHEALIQRWERLREWIDASRADIRQQRLLATAAAEWENAGRERSFLLSGSRLAQFEDWAARTDLALTPGEHMFLEASVTEQHRQEKTERERQQQLAEQRQRAANRLRALVVGLAVFLLAALGLSVLALGQRNNAQDARATSDANAQIARQSAAEARELALINGAQAALSGGDADTALALAVAANRVQNPPPEAQVILSEAAYRPGTIRLLKGHTDPYTYSVAFSPDGRFALSGAADSLLLLWDVDPASPTFGTVLDRFEHTAPVWYVVFSRDARTALFASSDSKLYLVEVDLTSHTLGRVLHRFEGHTGAIEEVALSPDGRYALTASHDQTLILWDVDPASPTFGAALRRFEGHTDLIGHVDYSPDGHTALSGAVDGTMILWDVEPTSPTFGAALHRFEVPGGTPPAVAFSPDGRTAASGADAVILWDLESHTTIHRFETGSFSYEVAFSPNGDTVLAAQADGIISLWNADTGKLVTRLAGHSGGVVRAVFSPDGRHILSCGLDDGLLRLWNVSYGAEMQTIASPYPANVYLSAAAFSPDGQSILWGGVSDADEPEPAILTDGTTGQEIRRFEGYARGVSHVVFAPDGQTALISGWAGEMIMWNVETGERLHTFTGHMASIVVGSNATYTAFSPDGRTALSVAKEEQAILWDTAIDSPTFGQPIRHFISNEGEVLTFVPSFSPDGRTALTGTRRGPVLLWNVETGRVIYRLTGHSGFSDALFSPDGRMALSRSSGESYLILWNLETGQELRRLNQKAAPLTMVFSPDGRTAFSDTVEGLVTVWDVAAGRAIRHYSGAGSLGPLSPDGRSFLITPDGRNVMRWRVDTLDELVAWTLAHRYVRDLTCTERELYQIEPLCDAEGNYPSSTPYLTATPTALPTLTPTADLKRMTATPTATITATIAPPPAPLPAHVGANRGNVAIGSTQFWTYEGRAGEILTIRVEADHPANWDTRDKTEPTPEGGWFDTRLSVNSPGGTILLEGYLTKQHNDIDPGKNTNSQVEGLSLPVDGTYFILVSGNLLQTGGAYTLTIESQPPGTVTPAPGT